MRQGYRYYRTRGPRLTCVLGMVVFVCAQAHADVVGRLQFAVKNADTEKGIALNKWSWKPALKNGQAEDSVQLFRFDFSVE